MKSRNCFSLIVAVSVLGAGCQAERDSHSGSPKSTPDEHGGTRNSVVRMEDLEPSNQRMLTSHPGLKYETRRLTPQEGEIVLGISGDTYHTFWEYGVNKLRLGLSQRHREWAVCFYMEWREELSQIGFHYTSPVLLVDDYFPIRGALVQITDIVIFPSEKPDPIEGPTFGDSIGQVKLKIFKSIDELNIPAGFDIAPFPAANRLILPFDTSPIHAKTCELSLWRPEGNAVRPDQLLVILMKPLDKTRPSSVQELPLGSEVQIEGQRFTIRRIQPADHGWRYLHGWIELESVKRIEP